MVGAEPGQLLVPAGNLEQRMLGRRGSHGLAVTVGNSFTR